MTHESDKTDKAIVGVFERTAETFDSSGRFSHFGERLVEWAQLAPGSRVLDAATGRGALAFPAATRVGAQGRVIGIDISPNMLRETAKDVQSGHWENIELEQMDAEQLPYSDSTFDCVLCGFALWFFPHPDRALKQFYRVLKPGGRLALTTWAHDSPMHKLRRETLRPHLTLPAKSNDYEKKQRFDTRELLGTALQQASFVDAKVFTEDFVAVFAGADACWEEVWSTATVGELEKLPPSTLELVKADYYQRLQALKQQNGIHAVYRAMFAIASK